MGALCKEGIAADEIAPDFVVELVFVPPPGRDGTPAEVLADLPTACLFTPPARGEKSVLGLLSVNYNRTKLRTVIHVPVLLLLSETPEVAAVLDGAPIVATLGKALGGLEDGFASAALDTPFSSRKKMKILSSEYYTGLPSVL